MTVVPGARVSKMRVLPPGRAAVVGLSRVRAVPLYALTRVPGGIRVTVSIGIASSTANNDTSDELLHRADQALYRAKREGRNRVIAEAA